MFRNFFKATIAFSLFWLAVVTGLVVVFAREELASTVRMITITVGRVAVVGMWAAVIIFLAGGVVGIATAAWHTISRRRNENMRQRDGSHALQKMRMSDGSTVYFNLDDMAGFAARFHPSEGLQELGGLLSDNVAALVEYGKARQVRRAIQAMAPGDEAIINSEQPVKPPSFGGTARMLNGNAKPPKIIDMEPETDPAHLLEAQPMPPVESAINYNSRQMFALGAGDDGEVVRWPAAMYPHLRVHGKSQGSGKTNVIRTIAAAAIRNGAHVVVADLRNFKDWQDFRASAELVNANDPANVAAVIDNAHDEFKRRDQRLGDAGLSNIVEMRDDAPPRLIIVLAEFGRMWPAIKAAGLAPRVKPKLLDIAAMSGATGVHLVIEDQIPSGDVWPRVLTANATAIAGYNDQMYGTLVGHYKPHEIPPRSFVFDGKQFRTWDMSAADAQRAIAKLPPLNGYRLLPAPNGERTPPERQAERPHQRERTPERPTERTERTPVERPSPPPTDPPFDVRSAPKRDTIQWYIDHIGGTQADCRRWLEARGADISRGYVSDVYNGKFDDAEADAPTRPPAHPLTGHPSDAMIEIAERVIEASPDLLTRPPLAVPKIAEALARADGGQPAAYTWMAEKCYDVIADELIAMHRGAHNA